jgi:hypothetical protein
MSKKKKMKKKTKKEIINWISIIFTAIMFGFLTIIWYKSPLKDSLINLWQSADKTWWSESLVAGTLGYFGVGLFSLILYPVPLLAIYIYIYTKQLLKRFWKIK